MHRVLGLAAAISVATGFCSGSGTAPAEAAPLSFESIYVFGDSLSDVGNVFNLTGGALPPPTRYSGGRFSNGPVWSEYLAGELGLSLEASQPFTPGQVGAQPPLPDQSYSFAYGGASTRHSNLIPAGFPVPGLQGQVDLFAAGVDSRGASADPEALYVVWAGANDFMFDLTKNPHEVVANIRTAIGDLYDLGARTFLVPNLPDLGPTPIAEGSGPPSEPVWSTRSQAYNRLMSPELFQPLERSHDDISLIPLDVAGLFETILSDLSAYGFTEDGPGPAAGCLFPPNDCSPVASAENYFFWDELHPSTEVHRYIAEAALDSLASAGMGHTVLGSPFSRSAALQDDIATAEIFAVIPAPNSAITLVFGLLALWLTIRTAGIYSPPAAARAVRTGRDF